MKGKQNHLLWLVFAISMFFSMGVKAQNVTATFKNEPLKSVLKEIEKQTQMSVVYKVDEVNVNKSVSGTFKNTPVREVLSQVLGSNLTCDVNNKMITIRAAQSHATKSSQATSGPRKVTGKVVDKTGEPLIGVSVVVKGTTNGGVTDIDGNYAITVNQANPTLVFSYIGYTPEDVVLGNRSQVNVTLKEEQHLLNEVVVTAMGIRRKEKSLTYATQSVKAEDLMKVQDQNVANSLEGKVSGITITPSAGGAGGASKIILRGNKSILGNSTPLIVVDGVPMSNGIRGQKGFGGGEGFAYSGMSEGSNPLSLINPDDIESMNVLKGANAAALYGSQAANGVIMITTKKGREGKLDINYTSNVTFDTPLLTPKIQNVYGASVEKTGISPTAWGGKIADRQDNDLVVNVPLDSERFPMAGHDVYLRNRAKDDVKDFFRTGVTTNNSVSLSGGTETMRTYFSVANSHSNGMIDRNSYNRNTFNFRQTYNFFKRLNVDVSMNYAQTITRNRPGGGTVLNPIYHLYMTPRNIDMGYYKDNYSIADGKWYSRYQSYYRQIPGTKGFEWLAGQRADLNGVMQNWAYMGPGSNNPYWLINQNQKKQKEDRVFGTIAATVDIYDGLSFQARANYDHSTYSNNSREYATTMLPQSMSDYGRYGDSDSKSTEIYTDYLLSYNKEFGDYSVSATAGWVGHTVKGESKDTWIDMATFLDPNRRKLPTQVNYFETNAGHDGVTTSSKSSNWDKAYLLTAQFGWKEMLYVDGSYRRDWYRPYRLFKNMGIIDTDNYGYFGIGANAIISSMTKLPEWFNYLKFRASYSEVGNSIPNLAYFASSKNLQTGASTSNRYSEFKPKPETNRSFETGFEMLFFDNRLSLDLTYYNATMNHLYMETSTGSGLTQPLNSARVRNQGIEATIGYDFKLTKDLRWKTSYNISYNDNKIKATAFDEEGRERLIEQNVAGAHVRYKVGGSIGDMYVGDFARDKNGYIKLTGSGRPIFDNSGDNDIYVGNMNSKVQMGWSNTFNYKDFSLFFLINGRIGGKVISLTESYLDNYGLSQRTANARLAAERNNILATNYGNVPGMELKDGSGRIVPIEQYYQAVGGSSDPLEYIYSGTNFRLRELSMGYTFRDLFGMNKNLTVSFIARNLFFLYKDAPVDPDVSLSTGNGLGGFELFNMPSSRSYGLSLKVNF